MVSDSTTTVQDLKKRLAEFIAERDWDQYHHPKEVAISLVVEAGELLEVFQWANKKPVAELKKDGKFMARVRDEIPDVLGYCLDLAARLDIDVSRAFFEKMEKNRRKYPVEKSKGNHKKYTEL